MLQRTDSINIETRQHINYFFEDFTEDSYKKLLLLGRKHYNFINYLNIENSGKNILLRHDIDYSVHRAYRISQIEKEVGVKSTFFLHLHSTFYNCFEEEIVKLIQKIIASGHEIGLHFDPEFYFKIYPKMNQEIINLNEFIELEKNSLEQLFQTSLNSISFHNPTSELLCKFNEEQKINGLINSYSKNVMKNFSYCSDSNGYWRFRRLKDVLTEATNQNLQILTHPEWWTPEILSPRDRITRCIEGRAKKEHMYYDQLLKECNRENIK